MIRMRRLNLPADLKWYTVIEILTILEFIDKFWDRYMTWHASHIYSLFWVIIALVSVPLCTDTWNLVCYGQMFIDEVMELVELLPLKDALVGLPGVSGLSTEQRKRLTIAVELVANPSIIFMDEPTSGLDARAAAIVMRAIRNTVDTGRTVVCTIHQPSIDIFESFDEVKKTIRNIVSFSRICIVSIL